MHSGLKRLSRVGRLALMSAVVGVVSGLLSAAFLESLNWATTTRTDRDWLTWLLPVAGLLVGLAYHHLGTGLERGTGLVIEQTRHQVAPIPLRIAPLVFVSSTVSHLFGASVGREGVALQLSAGVTDPLGRRLGLTDADRSLMLVAAIAGGFGSIVGAPVAGAVFALEVRRTGRVPRGAIVPALVASLVAKTTVTAIGVEHTRYPALGDIGWSWGLAGRTAIVGIVAGLLALAFVHLTDRVRDVARRLLTWPPLRPAVGGIVLALVVTLFGWQDYQGLSIPLAIEAMNGSAEGQWAIKFGLTVFSVGMGFVGGEVVPLIVIGSLAGAGLGSMTGGDLAACATVGAVAVLAAAMNTPLACTLLGVELFGGSGVVPFAAACAIAYVVSGRSGIYHPRPAAPPARDERHTTT